MVKNVLLVFGLLAGPALLSAAIVGGASGLFSPFTVVWMALTSSPLSFLICYAGPEAEKRWGPVIRRWWDALP